MINNFGSFVLEKQVVSLILENDLKGSYEFLKRLRKIRDKSKVANILSQLFADEYYIVKDLPQNWIDVTSEPEMVSFLSDQRARRTPMQWDEDESKLYEAPGRGQIRIGRFAQSLLSDPDVLDDIKSDNLDINPSELTPKDYEEFVNLYKAEFVVVENKFELVSGDRISYYYDFMNYAQPNIGQLGNSCMKYSKCQTFFGIYQKNPEVCQLLVYVNQDGKVLGRALVWKLDKKVDGCTAEYFMDRIYCTYDSDIIKFQNYAKERGWVIKNKNVSDTIEGLFFNFNDQVYLSHISVELQDWSFHEYPFFDTLSYLNTDSGKLHNVGGKKCIELTSTDGYYYDMNFDNRRTVLKSILEDILEDYDYKSYQDLVQMALDNLS